MNHNRERYDQVRNHNRERKRYDQVRESDDFVSTIHGSARMEERRILPQEIEVALDLGNSTTRSDSKVTTYHEGLMVVTGQGKNRLITSYRSGLSKLIEHCDGPNSGHFLFSQGDFGTVWCGMTSRGFTVGASACHLGTPLSDFSNGASYALLFRNPDYKADTAPQTLTAEASRASSGHDVVPAFATVNNNKDVEKVSTAPSTLTLMVPYFVEFDNVPWEDFRHKTTPYYDWKNVTVNGPAAADVTAPFETMDLSGLWIDDADEQWPVDVVSEQKRAQILIWIKHDVKTGLVLWSKAHNPKVSPKFRGRTLSQIWYQVMIGRLVGRELYSIETGFSFKQWSFAGDYTTMHVQLENEAQVQSGCRFDFVVSRDVIQKYHPDADRPSYFHRLAALPQQWFEGLGAEWAACTSGFSLLLDGVFQRYSPREDKLEAAAVKTKDREVPLEADVQLERLSHWLLGAFGNQGQLKTIARLLDQSFYSPVTDGTALRVKDLVNRRGLWSGRYNSRMPVRRTPLAVASYFSNIDIMRTLLDAGADPNLETPLEEVLVGRSDTSKAYKRMNYPGAVALLLERGACPWNMRDDLLIFGQDRYLRQQIDEHSCDKCLVPVHK
jgi:hypothetical protein